jgi:hypothetical protein
MAFEILSNNSGLQGSLVKLHYCYSNELSAVGAANLNGEIAASSISFISGAGWKQFELLPDTGSEDTDAALDEQGDIYNVVIGGIIIANTTSRIDELMRHTHVLKATYGNGDVYLIGGMSEFVQFRYKRSSKTSRKNLRNYDVSFYGQLTKEINKLI